MRNGPDRSAAGGPPRHASVGTLRRSAVLIALVVTATACDIDLGLSRDLTTPASRGGRDAATGDAGVQDALGGDARVREAAGGGPGVQDTAGADATVDDVATGDTASRASSESADTSTAGDERSARRTVAQRSTPATTAGGDGIWVGSDEIRRLPTSGPAWSHLKRRADERAGSPALHEDDNKHHANVLAQALVAARLDSDRYRRSVRDELLRASSSGSRRMSVLGPARKLTSYVVAADLIDLASFDPAGDREFRSWLESLRRKVFDNGSDPALSIAQAHEVRPNNFGTAAGAARIAMAVYLGDSADLKEAAAVFRGWLGDRGSYADFDYGSLSWQARPARPVGINPRGSSLRISGRSRNVDGVLPEEQRRQGGGVSWPPKKERYVYSGLQGAVAQAELLSRQGYDAWSWSDSALRRAVDWLHRPHFEGATRYPATGTRSEWIMPLLNERYDRSYPWSPGFWRGNVIGYTDWTHGS